VVAVAGRAITLPRISPARSWAPATTATAP
jgi:hypothetical protein